MQISHEVTGSITRRAIGPERTISKAADASRHREPEIARMLTTQSENSTSDSVVGTRAADGSTVSDEQYEEMLKTQAQMAAKMVANELTRSEILKLNLLRWAIGREEEARFAAQIRNLDALVALQEKLARQVDRLVAAVSK